MKKSIIAGLIILVLIGATSVWPRKATAQPDQRVAKHQVVVLHAQEWSNNQQISTNTFSYQYAGMRVYNSSSSPGAPTFTNLTVVNCYNCYSTNQFGGVVYGTSTETTTTSDLAEDIALCMDRGFVVSSIVQNNGANGELLTRVILIK